MSAMHTYRKQLQNNDMLASIFHQMADCYHYLGKRERFRAAAYDNVSAVLHHMKEDIAHYATDVQTLDQVGSIGESIAKKIIEYLSTGKINAFEKLKKRVPFQLLELLDITGFGPATLRILHDKMGINNREDLIKALEAGNLTRLKGFGEKKIANMKRSLKLIKDDHRMPFKNAFALGNELLKAISIIPGVQLAELAGSIRRKKETIGDIDIIIIAEPGKRKSLVNRFIALPQVAKVLAKGIKKASVLLSKDNIQVDIRIVEPFEYGSAMLYFTGSKEHNIKLRTIARNRGFKINEYGLFDLVSGKRLAGSTEEEIYHCLRLSYIPPEKRLGKDEIEQAVKKNGRKLFPTNSLQ